MHGVGSRRADRRRSCARRARPCLRATESRPRRSARRAAPRAPLRVASPMPLERQVGDVGHERRISSRGGAEPEAATRCHGSAAAAHCRSRAPSQTWMKRVVALRAHFLHRPAEDPLGCRFGLRDDDLALHRYLSFLTPRFHAPTCATLNSRARCQELARADGRRPLRRCASSARAVARRCRRRDASPSASATSCATTPRCRRASATWPARPCQYAPTRAASTGARPWPSRVAIAPVEHVAGAGGRERVGAGRVEVGGAAVARSAWCGP